MKTAGTILRDERIKKKISSKTVSQETCIPLNVVEAIEKDDYRSLPADPYPLLYLQDYAKFLGLDGKLIASIFKRDAGKKENSAVVKNSRFFWNPKLTNLLIFVLISLLFLGYLLRQYLLFNKSPLLEVRLDRNRIAEEIIVEGETDIDAVVSVNGKKILVDQEGSFREEIKASDNLEEIMIEAEGVNGKKTVIIKKIGEEN